METGYIFECQTVHNINQHPNVFQAENRPFYR